MRFRLTYGLRGQKGYVVMDARGQVVFQDDSKVMCIAKSQELNGFFVDGNEQHYGQQIRERDNAKA